MPSPQKKYTTLVSNTLLFAISNFSSKLLSFFIRPYLSYALDSPDVMGVSSLLQQATNLLIPVVSLGVAYAVIRFGLDKETDKSSVFVNGAATISLGFVVLLLAMPLVRLIPNAAEYLGFLYLCVLASCLRTLCTQFIRARMLNRLVAIDGVLTTLSLLLYYLLFLMRQSENFSANIRDFSLDPAIIKPVVAVGAAELIQSLNLIFAALLLNNLAASYGDDTVAAFGLAMRLNMVPEMLCMGLCMGGIPLYAYAYGARNGARVKEALRTATILSVATSAIITIPVLIFRRELLAVVGDASLIDTGEEIMVALMLAAVFNAVSIVFVSWFQAAGKGGPAMLMTLGIALLFFPAVYFGNMWFGFKGLTWAFPFTQVLACALGLVLFLATGGAKVPPAEAEVETEGSEDSDVQAAQVSGAQPEQKA